VENSKKLCSDSYFKPPGEPSSEAGQALSTIVGLATGWPLPADRRLLGTLPNIHKTNSPPDYQTGLPGCYSRNYQRRRRCSPRGAPLRNWRMCSRCRIFPDIGICFRRRFGLARTALTVGNKSYTSIGGQVPGADF